MPFLQMVLRKAHEGCSRACHRLPFGPRKSRARRQGWVKRYTDKVVLGLLWGNLKASAHPKADKGISCRAEVCLARYLKAREAPSEPAGKNALGAFAQRQDDRAACKVRRGHILMHRKRVVMAHHGDPPLLRLQTNVVELCRVKRLKQHRKVGASVLESSDG